MSNYRFYLIDALNVSTQVFPLNTAEMNFKFQKRNEGDIVMQVLFEQELIFKNSDYTYLKNKETTAFCEELTLRIDKQCNGTYSPFWYGRFAPMECKWKPSRCEVSVKPRLKEFMMGDLQINILDIPNNGGVDDVYTGNFIAGTQRIYTNCRHFEDVLLYIAQNSNPNITGIISNFFQINPLIVSSTILPGVQQNYSQMFLASLSDIQEPIPSNPATKEFVSFNQLMNDLNTLFDVFWYIDDNNNLRIEHRIFFDGVQGLDLTQPQYTKWLQAMDGYSYKFDDVPKYETWKIQGGRQYSRLVYNGCANLAKQQNEKTRQTTHIHTDYYSIRYGTGSSNSTGLFLFACYQSLGLFRMFESSGQNIFLTATNLMLKFHRYGRPQTESQHEYYQTEDPSQLINFNQGTFLAYSVAPTKLQEKISVPLCCDDEFNIKNQVLTNEGKGYLETAMFNSLTNMLELELKYKTVNDVPDITPNQLSGLDLWLKGDAGVIYNPTTFRVSQWTDFSGNNRHAVQPSTSLQPLYSPSGELLQFSNYYLTTPAFQLFPAKRGCIFILYGALPGPFGLNTLISTNDGAPGFNFFDVSTSVVPPNTLISANYGSVYPSYVINGLMSINRYDDNNMEIFQNGLKPFSNPMNVPTGALPSIKPFWIGKNTNIGASAGGNFNIREIIVYDRTITDVERQKIELYLAKKWDISLYTGI